MALGLEVERRYADLCEDLDWQDHHIGSGALGHHRECEGQDPRQRGNSPRSAEIDLCWQTVGRWPHPVRLQHPEGKHSSLGAQTAWRKLNGREKSIGCSHLSPGLGATLGLLF